MLCSSPGSGTMTLAELKSLVDGSKLVEGKLSPATVKKANKLLLDAV